MRDYVLSAVREGKSVLNFGPVTLSILTSDTPLGGLPGGDRDFFMAKSSPYIEGYAEITKGRTINSILELGIYKGGSVVFFDQFFRPKQLCAIDLEENRIAKLDAYVADYATSAISLYYGVNQADKAALRTIIADNFPDGIDFVVDDASHFYEPSKDSFEAIFPHLNVGGLYVIEDWSWSFSNPADGGDNEDVTRLLNQLIAVHAKYSGIISQIHLYPGFLCIVKGHSLLPEGVTSLTDIFPEDVLANKDRKIVELEKIVTIQEECITAKEECILAQKERIAGIESSTSWKITAPLRALKSI